jgi:hypothetical protein
LPAARRAPPRRAPPSAPQVGTTIVDGITCNAGRTIFVEYLEYPRLDGLAWSPCFHRPWAAGPDADHRQELCWFRLSQKEGRFPTASYAYGEPDTTIDKPGRSNTALWSKYEVSPTSRAHVHPAPGLPGHCGAFPLSFIHAATRPVPSPNPPRRARPTVRGRRLGCLQHDQVAGDPPAFPRPPAARAPQRALPPAARQPQSGERGRRACVRACLHCALLRSRC